MDKNAKKKKSTGEQNSQRSDNKKARDSLLSMNTGTGASAGGGKGAKPGQKGGREGRG